MFFAVQKSDSDVYAKRVSALIALSGILIFGSAIFCFIYESSPPLDFWTKGMIIVHFHLFISECIFLVFMSY